MKTNVYHEVFNEKRFILLQSFMGVDDVVAIGCLVKIWRHCEQNETAEITSDEMMVLTRRRKFILAAEKSGFVSRINTADDLFKVKGMSDRLNELSKYFEKKRESGRLGGKRKAENASKNLAHASGMLDVCLANGLAKSTVPSPLSLGHRKNTKEDPNAYVEAENFDAIAPTISADAESQPMQLFEAELIEVKTKPKRARKQSIHDKVNGDVISLKEDTSKQRTDASWSTQAFDFWKQQYRSTYNAEPGQWSKAEWGCLKQLYEKTKKDIDKLCLLIEHYFTRRDYAFTASGHSLMKLLPSFHRLWAEIQNGQRITEQDIRNASRNEGNRNAGQMAIERIESGAKSNLERLDDIAAELIAEEKRIHQSEFRRALEASGENNHPELI